MSIQGFQLDSPLTYLTAAAPIASNLLVTLTATAGTVDLCGENGVPVGIADGAIPAASYGAFRPLQGRVQVVAASAFLAGDYLCAAAAGEVEGDAGSPSVTRSVNTIGQAETAASNPGDVVWMVCLK
jgi:hypothetical protein